MNKILKKLLNYYKYFPSILTNNFYLNSANEMIYFNNLQKILKKHKITYCLDVGANIGHYSLILRKTGFTKTIIAFEPLKKYYNISKNTLGKEKNIFVENIGIGNKNGTQEINIASNNGLSSSFLEFSSNRIFTKTKTENVKIQTIETYLTNKKITSQNLFMKLDVQGYEFEILKSISNFKPFLVIQLEMSFFEYYKNQPTFEIVNKFMEEKGYKIAHLKINGNDNFGKIIELDVIYTKINN